MTEFIAEAVASVLLILGATLMLIAAIGVVRLPDIFLRMAATSKAATMGGACSLLALAVFFLDFGVMARALVTIVFLFMTAPIAAHMIGRAAYNTGARMWEGTVLDEMASDYPQRAERLRQQGETTTGTASTPASPDAPTSSV